MTFWTAVLLGVAGYVLLVALVLGVFALGKRDDEARARALRPCAPDCVLCAMGSWRESKPPLT